MSDDLPDVSLVIVSWNALSDLVCCLDSVALSTQRFRLETIVVDNASSEPVVEQVRTRYPDVRVIANQDNRGFSSACNQGFGVALGEFILFLNPDTVLIEPDAIDRLVDALRSSPGTVAVGPRLVFPDGRHQVGDAGMRPTVASALSHSLGMSRWLWRFAPGIYVVGDRAGGAGLDVDWICGAALLVRSRAFGEIRGFNEELFMYAEDIDLGCRLKRGDQRIRYLPSVTVRHVGGASLRTASSADVVSTRWIESLVRVYSIRGGRHWRSFKLALAIGFALRWAGCLTDFGLRRDLRLRQRARVFRTYFRETMRLKKPEMMKRGTDLA